MRFRATKWDSEQQGEIQNSKMGFLAARRNSEQQGAMLRLVWGSWSSIATDDESALIFRPPSGAMILSRDCPIVSSVHFPFVTFPLVSFLMYFQSPERKQGPRKRRVSVDYSANYGNREICTKAKMISQDGTTAQYPTA